MHIALIHLQCAILPVGVQQVDARRADQLGDKSGGRAVVNVLGRTDLDDAPLIEHPDAVGHGQGFDLVVGDERSWSR